MSQHHREDVSRTTPDIVTLSRSIFQQQHPTSRCGIDITMSLTVKFQKLFISRPSLIYKRRGDLSTKEGERGGDRRVVILERIYRESQENEDQQRGRIKFTIEEEFEAETCDQTCFIFFFVKTRVMLNERLPLQYRL